MIRTKIFQKYFLLASTLLVVFIALGFFFNSYLKYTLLPPKDRVPQVFMAKVIDKLIHEDRVQAIHELTELRGNTPGPQFILLNENGESVYPKDYQKDFDWDKIQKPQQAYAFTTIHKKQDEMFHLEWSWFGQEDLRPYALVKLDKLPVQYLLITPTVRAEDGKRLAGLHWMGFTSLLLSLILGVGFAMAVISHLVKKNVMAADKVISELRRGNLKARLPIRRKDEFGHAMMRFNYMADDIERLITTLKAKEKNRSDILIKALDDLKATVDFPVSEAYKQKLKALSVLTKISDPTYPWVKSKINFSDVVEKVSKDFQIDYEDKGIDFYIDDKEELIEYLLSMISGSATSEKLKVSAVKTPYDHVCVSIENIDQEFIKKASLSGIEASTLKTICDIHNAKFELRDSSLVLDIPLLD